MGGLASVRAMDVLRSDLLNQRTTVRRLRELGCRGLDQTTLLPPEPTLEVDAEGDAVDQGGTDVAARLGVDAELAPAEEGDPLRPQHTLVDREEPEVLPVVLQQVEGEEVMPVAPPHPPVVEHPERDPGLVRPPPQGARRPLQPGVGQQGVDHDHVGEHRQRGHEPLAPRERLTHRPPAGPTVERRAGTNRQKQREVEGGHAVVEPFVKAITIVADAVPQAIEATSGWSSTGLLRRTHSGPARSSRSWWSGAQATYSR